MRSLATLGPGIDAESVTSGGFGVDVRRGHRQAPWSGYECQNEDCGGTRTKVRTSGRDSEGRPLRDRVCQDCGTAFVTVETVVVAYGGDTAPVRFAEVDVEHRRRKRENKRRKFGWRPGGYGAPVKKIVGAMHIDGRFRRQPGDRRSGPRP